MTKVFVQLAFAALGLAVVRAHGGAEGQEVEFAFRQMFEVEAGQVHQLVILHQEDHEEGHVIMLSTPNCHESELAAVDPHELEERELDELVPGPALVQTSDLGGFSFETDHLGMYLFNLNLSSTCWIVLHSDASKVFLMESSTGEQVHPMFDLELKAEPVQNTAEVSGQVAGAVMLVCCLPIILVAIFYLGVSAVSSLINFGLAALFMQSFGCGALLSVTVFHVYPEMVSALEENNVPQWQGGALILGSICVLILVQLVSSKFHDHNHMKHANHETDVDESEPKHVPGAVAEGNEDVEAPSSKEIVDPAAVEKPSMGIRTTATATATLFNRPRASTPPFPKRFSWAQFAVFSI
ncbi:hypothetical protein BASA81_003431 [Batrachochytrium salamandrivorans]|nr:hypothetical protein BASA81_003431 [Batrachochytrium salamandrivorans]